MFYLTGTAATSALDLIATLQQTLGTNNSGASSSATTFDPGTTTSGTSSTTSTTPSDANGPTSLLAPNTLDALLAVQGQGQAPIVNGDAFSQQLFSLLDTNGDGSISKSEFETAFGQNGNTTQADQIFAKLDTNGDGSISQTELTNAIDGQDQLQSQGGQQVHHHHHHDGFGAMAASMGGGADAASGSGSDSGGDATDPLAALGGTSQTVTNSDGSTTTTISYSDGSQVSMTLPAANSSSSGSGGSSSSGSGSSSSGSGGLGNYLEQMIARQAQMLANLGAAAGQSLAVTV